MLCLRCQHPRPLTWVVFLACFVFIAIRISGVHPHIVFAHAESGLGDITTLKADFSHIEMGLLHPDHADLHDHSDLQNDHGDSEGSSEHVVHADITFNVLLRAFAVTSKFNDGQVAIFARALFWQVMPVPPTAIPRYNTTPLTPQTPRLRPPSCGPPKFFIA